MKLTPIDVRQQQFPVSLRGFDRREVGGFLEIVAQQIAELTRENMELRADLRRANGDLDEHKSREQTLREAMLTAQSAIDEIRQQAEKQAQLTLTEAELRAEKLMLDAHKRVGKVLEDVQDLKRQRARALEELRGVLRTHERLLAVHDEASTQEGEDEATVTILDRVRAPAPPELMSRSKLGS